MINITVFIVRACTLSEAHVYKMVYFVKLRLFSFKTAQKPVYRKCPETKKKKQRLNYLPSILSVDKS